MRQPTNYVLANIVVAAGGTVTNKDNRDQLLQDWGRAYGLTFPEFWNVNGDQLRINGELVYSEV